MCVCVCVLLCVSMCVYVRTSPNVEPIQIDRSCSNLISRVLLQIYGDFFLVFLLPLKLRVVHIRKNLKFSISQKWLQRFSSKFVDLLYVRTPTIWHYWLFPEKILLTRIIICNFLCRLT